MKKRALLGIPRESTFSSSRQLKNSLAKQIFFRRSRQLKNSFAKAILLEARTKNKLRERFTSRSAQTTPVSQAKKIIPWISAAKS